MFKKIVVFTTVVLLSTSLWAQKVIYQEDEFESFKAGLELVEYNKFGSARDHFEDYLRKYPSSLRSKEAEYYVALSAISLLHDDGQSLLESFINENPSHPKSYSAYYDLGVFYFNEKDFDKSLEYLRKIDVSRLSIGQMHDANFKLGYSYFHKKDYKSALRYFNLVKSASEEYGLAAKYYAGFIQYKEGNFDEALRDLQQAEEHPSYSAVVPYLIANIYYGQGRYDDVISYGNKVLSNRRKVQNRDDIQLLIGESYFRKQEFETAAPYFEKYSKSKKQVSKDILYRLAYCQYIANDFDKATQNFKVVALKDDAMGQTASYYLGNLYLKQDNKPFAKSAFLKASEKDFDPNIKEESAFNVAKLAFEGGSFSEAINELERFMNDYPSSQYRSEANQLLSKSYLNTNNYGKALDHLDYQSNLSTEQRDVYQKVAFYRGAELFNQGSFKESVTYFSKSLNYPIDSELTIQANYWAAEAFSTGKKYKQALAGYQKVFQLDRNSEYYTKAKYGAAYCYYNQKDYDKALLSFKEYTQKLGSQGGDQFAADAYVRMADCHFVVKDYQAALNYYDQALTYTEAERDYATYQKGVIYSFQGNSEQAGKNFLAVINKSRNSRYRDDAAYQYAQIDFDAGNFQRAIKSYDKLLSSMSKSPLAPMAHLKRGLCHNNLGKPNNAITDFKIIINKYPTSNAAEDAIYSLQDALSQTGKANEFAEYLEKYKRANPEKEGVESIEYESAKNLYFSGNYREAIKSLNTFVRNFPRDYQRYEAKYYLAESYYRLDELEKSLSYHIEVVEDDQIPQVNKSMKKAAEMSFDGGNYDQATDYYQLLAESASNKDDQLWAWEGLMKSNYILRNYTKTEQFANLIIESGVGSSKTSMAYLYIGKAAYETRDGNKAIDNFLQVLNTAQDADGAEAKYMIAKIQHNQKKYQQSSETIYEFNESFASYDYWLGRAFLLLADNFIAQDETFQAQQTLKSIIDNSDDQDVVEQAKLKLQRLEKEEADREEQSEVVIDPGTGNN